MADVDISPVTEAEAADLVDRVSAGARDERDLALAAREDGRMVGGLIARVHDPDPQPSAWALVLWVAPSARHRGLERRLIDAAAIELSASRPTASTLTFHISAHGMGVIALAESLDL